METISIVIVSLAILFVLFILAGIRIVRPTQRGAVETLGKYTGFVESGFNWIVPIFQSIKIVNITEKMAKIEPQEVIKIGRASCRERV